MSDLLKKHDEIIATVEEKFIVNTKPVEITAERVSDLLCGAFEGYSGDWCSIQGYDLAEGISKDDMAFPHTEVPFIKGCAIIIKEDDVEKPHRLDWDAMVKGLQIMADKYDWHLKNFIEQNDDAETSDVFLQCSTLGDIVYG